MRCLLARLGVIVAAAFAAGAPRTVSADGTPTPSVPVTIEVIGHGQIRLLVADGASRPCDADGNRVLFNAHVRAGDEMKLTSTSGSVCVDHTYGSLRESQWAGGSIWSGRSTWPGGPEPAIHGTVSTDDP